MGQPKYCLYSLELGFWAGESSLIPWAWDKDKAMLFDLDEAIYPVFEQIKNEVTGSLRVIQFDRGRILNRHQLWGLIQSAQQQLGEEVDLPDAEMISGNLAIKANNLLSLPTIYPLRNATDIDGEFIAIIPPLGSEGEEPEPSMMYVNKYGEVDDEPEVFHELQYRGSLLVTNIVNKHPDAMEQVHDLYRDYAKLTLLGEVASDGAEEFDVVSRDGLICDFFSKTVPVTMIDNSFEDFTAQLMEAAFKHMENERNERMEPLVQEPPTLTLH